MYGPGDSNADVGRGTDTDLATSEKMEVLVGIYEQLDQNHHHHNKVIFQTYYLSVVFFGAVGSVLLGGDRSDLVTAGIAVFGSLVMLVLWFWAYMYLKGRRQIKEHKANIIDELRQHDREFTRLDGVEDAFFFRHDETPERTVLETVLRRIGWDVDGDFMGVEHKKDVAQWGYFLVLAVVFAGTAAYVLV